jgi:DNA-binding beta-propeller fold protein YncE
VEEKMKNTVVVAVLALLVPMFVAVAQADGNDNPTVRPFAAQIFAVMPEIANFPEGITANPHNGDIFVSTFEFDTTGTETNGIVRFNRHGRVEAKSNFENNNVPLLGLAFNKNDNNVYIASVGDFQGVGSKIQRIAANFPEGATLEMVAEVPAIGAPAPRIVTNPDTSIDTIEFGDYARVPNGLAFHGNALYFSDSFQGAIFRIDNPNTCAPSCVPVTIVHHPLLATAGFPPFGANGLVIRGNTLFVANTGDDTVLAIPLNDAGTATDDPTEFARSINGADGMALDRYGRVWVAANQGDRLVMINDNGRVDAQLGGFFGIGRKGTPIGLSFPASMAIVGDKMFVTNLSLPLTPTMGDEWEEKVKRYTVSRISIPPYHNHHYGGGH